jgi:hypothetical protein
MGVVVAAVRDGVIVLPNAGEVKPPPPCRGVSTGFRGVLPLFIEGDGLPHENDSGAVDEDDVAMVPIEYVMRSNNSNY